MIKYLEIKSKMKQLYYAMSLSTCSSKAGQILMYSPIKSGYLFLTLELEKAATAIAKQLAAKLYR